MEQLITTSLGHYYEVKASIISQDKNGMIKRVRTALVIDAASFGDAENTALKILGEEHADPQILAITPASYNEVYAGQFCERFFKVKVNTITYSDGKEKAQNIFYLVDAQDINEAKNIIKSIYDKSMTDEYDIIAIAETPITTFVFDHKVMPL